MLDVFTQLLINLGIKPEKRGFYYLKLVLEILRDSQTTLKSAYNKISVSEKINICTIDSSIRNAIISAHKSGKLIRLNSLLGCDVINAALSPTNKELIMYLLQIINIDSKELVQKINYKGVS